MTLPHSMPVFSYQFLLSHFCGTRLKTCKAKSSLLAKDEMEGRKSTLQNGMMHALSSLQVKGGIGKYHTALVMRCLNLFSWKSEQHNFLLKLQPSFKWLKTVLGFKSYCPGGGKKE